MLTQIVSESLHTLLGPSFDALEVLALMLIVELLDAAFELDLRRAQRMDLLELLQVEERLGDGQLVAAAGRGKEALEFRAVR